MILKTYGLEFDYIKTAVRYSSRKIYYIMCAFILFAISTSVGYEMFKSSTKVTFSKVTLTGSLRYTYFGNCYNIISSILFVLIVELCCCIKTEGIRAYLITKGYSTEEATKALNFSMCFMLFLAVSVATFPFSWICLGLINISVLYKALLFIILDLYYLYVIFSGAVLAVLIKYLWVHIFKIKKHGIKTAAVVTATLAAFFIIYIFLNSGLKNYIPSRYLLNIAVIMGKGNAKELFEYIGMNVLNLLFMCVLYKLINIFFSRTETF